MNVVIRNAARSDAAYIATALHELAEHDGHGEECLIRAEDVLRFGFGPNPRFEVLIAEIDGRRCGFALYYFIFSPWDGRPRLFMSDLYVDDRARGAGIGRRLMQELAKIALAQDCIRMDWEVLPEAEATHFYRRIGARPVHDFHKYCISGEALRALAATAP